MARKAGMKAFVLINIFLPKFGGADNKEIADFPGFHILS
jgi:hypothetical protein